MQKIEISKFDLQLLKKERFIHPHPRVMLKMEVVYLKGLGYSNDEVCKIADVCDNTVREYLRQYAAGGIERLKEVNFHKPGSELQDYCETIEKYFTEHPPSSISQASAIIETMTGIKRGETQIRKFLKSLNFRYMKTGSVPAKVLTEVKKTNRENFWKKSLNPD